MTFDEHPQTANVGAYRIRPNAHTYSRGCFSGRMRYAPTSNRMKCGHSYCNKEWKRYSIHLENSLYVSTPVKP